MKNSLYLKAQYDLKTFGIEQQDKRLKRKVLFLSSYTLQVDGDLLNQLKYTIPEKKYNEDFKRMWRSMQSTCKILRQDPLSRRGVIFNTSKYFKIFPCFLSLQVVPLFDEMYSLVVYQRSGDLEKMIPDVTFFSNIARRIEVDAKIYIKILVVLYGHFHCKKEE